MELDKINFDLILSHQSSEEEKSSSRINVKTIEFIVMVGFHHKVGSQVEYIYPPINEDVDGDLTADFLK